MVGKQTTLASWNQRQNEGDRHSHLRFKTVISPDLSLAIISGEFDNKHSVARLECHLESIKAHLITSDRLTIHMAVESVDQNSIGLLVDLVRVLNIASFLDKVITVHWVNCSNSVVNRIGEEFQMTSAFNWKNQG